MMGIGFSKMGFVQCVLNWNMGKSLYFCFRHGLFSCQKPPLDMEMPPRVGDKPCHMFPMKPRKKNNVSHSVNRGSCIMFIPWTILKPAWFNMFPYVFHVFPFIIVFPSANPQVRICPFFPARRPWPHLVDFKPSSRCSCDLCRGCNDRWYRWFEKKINRSVEWNIYRKTKKCISGWWYTYPLKNMKVSWDDGIPNIWKNKIYVPNHQPDLVVCFQTDLREKKVPSTLGSMGLLNNYCIMGI